MSLADSVAVVDLLVGIGVLAGMAYGFYTGAFQRWLRGLVGYGNIEKSLESVKKDTKQLREDHQETIEKLETLEEGQMHLADRMQNHHDSVDLDWFRDNLDVDHPRHDDDD